MTRQIYRQHIRARAIDVSTGWTADNSALPLKKRHSNTSLSDSHIQKLIESKQLSQKIVGEFRVVSQDKDDFHKSNEVSTKSNFYRLKPKFLEDKLKKAVEKKKQKTAENLARRQSEPKDRSKVFLNVKRNSIVGRSQQPLTRMKGPPLQRVQAAKGVSERAQPAPIAKGVVNESGLQTSALPFWNVQQGHQAGRRNRRKEQFYFTEAEIRWFDFTRYNIKQLDRICVKDLEHLQAEMGKPRDQDREKLLIMRKKELFCWGDYLTGDDLIRTELQSLRLEHEQMRRELEVLQDRVASREGLRGKGRRQLKSLSAISQEGGLQSRITEQQLVSFHISKEMTEKDICRVQLPEPDSESQRRPLYSNWHILQTFNCRIAQKESLLEGEWLRLLASLQSAIGQYEREARAMECSVSSLEEQIARLRQQVKLKEVQLQNLGKESSEKGRLIKSLEQNLSRSVLSLSRLQSDFSQSSLIEDPTAAFLRRGLGHLDGLLDRFQLQQAKICEMYHLDRSFRNQILSYFRHLFLEEKAFMTSLTSELRVHCLSLAAECKRIRCRVEEGRKNYATLGGMVQRLSGELRLIEADYQQSMRKIKIFSTGCEVCASAEAVFKSRSERLAKLVSQLAESIKGQLQSFACESVI